MGDFEILSLSEASKWKEYLEQLPIEQQDIYYTPEYYRLYEDLGDGKACCFVFKKGVDIALYPFLINSVNALGYDLDKQYYDIQGAYGYNGVISSSYETNFIDTFYSRFNSYCNESNIIAEFTRFHPLLKNRFFFSKKTNVIFDRSTVFVDLRNDFRSIFQHFQSTTRKQIRRIENRYGIKLKILKADSQVAEEFYSIYRESMDRVNSTEYLYFNKKYFEQIANLEESFFFMACKEEKPVSAIIAMKYGQYIHGHLGGTTTKYLNLSPSSFLYSEIIRFGKKAGCTHFHVGGGATQSIDDPVLKYKKNFSKENAEFYIGKNIYDLKIYNKIVNQWEKLYPEKIAKYKNHLLKYHF